VRLEPIIEMPCLMTAVWRRLGVHLFEGKVTVEDMDRLEASGEIWHQKIPGKLVELAVIHPGDALMTSEERQRMSRIIKRWEKDRVASATVILAQGLKGSLHRSVLTGLQMIAPAPHPVKVFGTTREAMSWLAPHAEKLCGPEATSKALIEAVDDLLVRFAARPKKAPGALGAA